MPGLEIRRYCQECGTERTEGKFCMVCGKPAYQVPDPDFGQIPPREYCPECGTKRVKGKYCTACGAKPGLPVMREYCPECGTVRIKGKYCMACGAEPGLSVMEGSSPFDYEEIAELYGPGPDFDNREESSEPAICIEDEDCSDPDYEGISVIYGPPPCGPVGDDQW